MRKRDYLKVNNPNAFDKLDQFVNIGSVVVFASYYYPPLNIGIVDHYTPSGKLAIKCKSPYHSIGEFMCYRDPETVVKISDKSKGIENGQIYNM